MAFSITGLSNSGLDTTQIVSDLMKVERIPYTNLETRKTNLQTEQTVFRNVNTKLKSLENILSELQYSTNLNAYKATASSNAVSFSTNGTSSAALAGSYEVKVEQIAKQATSTVSGSELLTALQSGNFAFGGLDFYRDNPTNPKDIPSSQNKDFINNSLEFSKDITDEQKLKNLVSYINSQSSIAGATATMVKTQSGEFSIKLTSNSSADVDIQTGATLAQTKVAGQTAKFSVNGNVFTSESNTINDVIPGVTFTLSASTGAKLSDANDASTPTIITVGADTDKIVEKIKSFVSAYNDVVSLVQTNLAKPEDDDTVNPLQSDSLLKDISSRLYSIFNQFTGDGFMEDIGLSIDKGVTTASNMTRQITFDESTFVNTLNSNPSKVSKILENVSDTMYTTVNKTWTSSLYGVLSKKITGYDNQIKQADEKLEQMDRSLEMKEARLKLQFSNMEVMLNSLQSTQSWLTSQFEALTKSS